MTHPTASRVTVDLDGYRDDFALAAVRAYHELDRVAAKVEVRISSSGGGLHLIGWMDQYLDDDEMHRLRRHLGDDAKRVMLDELPEHHRGRAVNNVLWTQKGDGEADDDFDNFYDALDHVQMTA